MAGQVELLVAEDGLAAEEDDHQPEAFSGRLDERDRQQRATICLLGGFREPFGEAAVIAEPARRKHLPRSGALCQRRGLRSQVASEVGVEPV
jgi:hypothetical protein